MRFPRALSLFASFGLAACGGGGVDLFGGGGGPTAPQTFLLTTAAENSFGSHTLISHPDLDGNPTALLLATPVWNPGGTGGTYVRSTIGVEWLPDTGQWSVFREDGALMPLDAAFAVTILPPIATNFSHRATVESIFGNTTYLDHPATNGNQAALVLITHAYAAGLGGARDPSPLGVWFNTARGQWGIFHEDGTGMDIGQIFFVCVLPTTDRSYVHVAPGAPDTAANRTMLTNPHLDLQPGALLHATHNWNPTGAIGEFNDSPIGVYYEPTVDRWAVFNQVETVGMTPGTAFNVWIPVP